MDAPEPSVAQSGVAHLIVPATVLASAIQELGEPLDLISAHAQLLLQSTDSATAAGDIAKSIEAIRILALRSRRRVRNIAYFARLERGHIGPVELNGLVSEAGRLLEPELRQQQAAIKFDLSPELPAVWGSESQLRHALANLIENAAESMSATDIGKREVTLATRFTSEGVSIEVSDRGCGFPAEAGERVYDPFFTTKPSGMGLGLAVVRGVVRSHGGLFIASRRAGGGMAIRISLPIIGAQVRETASEGPQISI